MSWKGACAGDRMRIFAHLIEAETGAHLWADKWPPPPRS